MPKAQIPNNQRMPKAQCSTRGIKLLPSALYASEFGHWGLDIGHSLVIGAWVLVIRHLPRWHSFYEI
jgi:hypothetical protein